MKLYAHLGVQIGSVEARELAQQLVVWHDAMVKHVRVVGPRRASACDDDCPHEEATVLWVAAQATFGDRAQELGFLRRHGERRRLTPRGAEPSRALEMRA